MNNQGYYLTESDRILLNRMKTIVAGGSGHTTLRQVTPKRTPRRGAGSSKLTIGMALKPIGAATIDGSAITATPGSTLDAVDLLVWDGASLKADDDGTQLQGINFSLTELRADVAEPVLVSGYRQKVNDVDSFIVVNVMDLRGLPFYDKTKMQVPYHDQNSGSYLLDAEDCQ